MKRTLQFLTILLISLLPTATSSADTFQKQLLWINQEHTEALFIPVAISRDVGLDELPIDAMDRATLLGDIYDKEQGAPCLVRRSRDAHGSARTQLAMSQMFDLPQVVFLGRVIEVVDGWNNWRQVIGRMAYVEITELIRPVELDTRFAPGRTVAVFFEGGETTIAGVELCSEPGTGAHVPSVGDNLLVGGVEWEGDDRHFNAFVKFPVVAGRVLSQPYPELRRNEKSTSLKDLLREIRQSVRRRPN